MAHLAIRVHDMNVQYEYERIVSEFGPWTAHNLRLSQNLYTISEGIEDRATKRAKTYSDIIAIMLNKYSLSNIRILDLGCLEGGIALNLAMNGATCVGVDVRPQHLAKADFAYRAIKPAGQCKWIEGDVTDQNTWKSVGSFDVIICSGLLYHLDAPDIIPLLRNIRMISKLNSVTIIDTNIVSNSLSSFIVDKTLTLHGRYWQEHNVEDTEEKRIKSDWSSYKNNRAFWLTERSLTNALIYSGYKFVTKPLYPFHEWGHKNRDIWVAVPGDQNFKPICYRNEPDERILEHPSM